MMALKDSSSNLEVTELLEKYKDLWQVERTFRTLKSQLAIRPMFHWTNKRIEGHIAMCFVAFTFLNYMKHSKDLKREANHQSIGSYSCQRYRVAVIQRRWCT